MRLVPAGFILTISIRSACIVFSFLYFFFSLFFFLGREDKKTGLKLYHQDGQTIVVWHSYGREDKSPPGIDRKRGERKVSRVGR